MRYSIQGKVSPGGVAFYSDLPNGVLFLSSRAKRQRSPSGSIRINKKLLFFFSIYIYIYPLHICCRLKILVSRDKKYKNTCFLFTRRALFCLSLHTL